MNRNIATVKTKEMLMRDLQTCRVNMIGAAILTLINIIILAAGGGSYFPFSFFTPYCVSEIFYALCGMYPPEEYAGIEGFVPLDGSIFWVVFAISCLITVGIGVLGFFSVKKKGISLASLILYVLDTLCLLYFSINSFNRFTVIEIIFHLWLLYYAVRSIRAWGQMEHAPTAAEVAASMGYHGSTYGNPYGTSYGTVPTADEPVAEATAEETVTTVTTDAPEEAADTPAEAPAEENKAE